jgi:hypothetical protein
VEVVALGLSDINSLLIWYRFFVASLVCVLLDRKESGWQSFWTRRFCIPRAGVSRLIRALLKPKMEQSSSVSLMFVRNLAW